jgi:hypothetical protein
MRAGATSFRRPDQLGAGPRDHPPARLVAAFLAVGAIVGSSVLLPPIGPNLTPTDPLLVAALAFGLAVSPVVAATPPKRMLRAIAPWLALLAASSILALTTSGITSWAVLSLGKSVYSFALFVGTYALFWGAVPNRRVLVGATGLAVVVVTVGLLVTWEPPARSAGTFYHPNYPGHFLAMALIVWWSGARNVPVLRWVITLVGLGGILLTSSFGAILMLFVAGIPSAVVWLRGHAWMAPAAAAAGLVGLLVVGFPLEDMDREEVEVTETLNADRFERSQEGRVDLWVSALDATVQHPLGLGPMGFRHTPEFSGKDVADDGRLAHNLYISYLVDRGPLGLFALIGLGFALWRHAPAGGMARPLLLAVAASNLVRETSHYRHMWIFFAVALTLDHAAEARRGEPAG